MPIRLSHRTQGGPFPGKGAAPTMAHDKVLPRGQRAGFEALNDAAAMHPTVMDAGSPVAADDNAPPQRSAPVTWSSKDLRLTRVQEDFLRNGQSSVHQRVQERTELILEARKMLTWKRSPNGTYYRGPSAKGEVALQLKRSK